MFGITSRNSRISRGGAVIIVQHAAQPLAALDCSMITIMGFIRDDQPVAETLVVSLEVIQVSNTTPILGISVKSAISGIHGTVGQYGCTPLS